MAGWISTSWSLRVSESSFWFVALGREKDRAGVHQDLSRAGREAFDPVAICPDPPRQLGPLDVDVLAPESLPGDDEEDEPVPGDEVDEGRGGRVQQRLNVCARCGRNAAQRRESGILPADLVFDLRELGPDTAGFAVRSLAGCLEETAPGCDDRLQQLRIGEPPRDQGHFVEGPVQQRPRSGPFDVLERLPRLAQTVGQRRSHLVGVVMSEDEDLGPCGRVL